MSAASRTLGALLPAALLAIVYVGWLRPPLTSEAAAPHGAAGGASAPTPAASQPALGAASRPAPRSSFDAAAANADLDRLNAALAASESDALIAWSQPARRTEVLADFAQRLRDQGLRIERSGPAADFALPAGLGALADAYAARGGARPQCWQLELRGAYPALQRALAARPGATDFLVPISTAFALDEHSQDFNDLSIALWVWI